MENHLKSHPEQLQGTIYNLQVCYGKLDLPDYVVGLTNSRKTEAPLEQRMFCYRVTGQFQDALGCYEGLGKSEKETSVEIVRSVLECYLHLDKPHTASSLAEGFSSHDMEKWVNLIEFEVEAAWRLSNWISLEEFILSLEHRQVNKNWRFCLAEILYYCYKRGETQI